MVKHLEILQQELKSLFSPKVPPVIEIIGGVIKELENPEFYILEFVGSWDYIRLQVFYSENETQLLWELADWFHETDVTLMLENKYGKGELRIEQSKPGDLRSNRQVLYFINQHSHVMIGYIHYKKGREHGWNHASHSGSNN